MRSLRITALWALLLGAALAAPVEPKKSCDCPNDDCCDSGPPPPPPPPPCYDDSCDDDWCGPPECDYDVHHHHHSPPPYYPPPPPPQPPPFFPFPFPFPPGGFPPQQPPQQPQQPPLPPTCAPNPLLNGNFNGGQISPWVASSATAITVVQSPPAAPGFGNGPGGYAVQFALASATAPGLTLTQASIAVCALHRYTLSFQMAWDAAAVTAACTVTMTFNGVQVAAVPLTAPNTGAQPQTMSFVTTNPTATTGAFAIQLVCTNAVAATQGFVYLDNIVLTV